MEPVPCGTIGHPCHPIRPGDTPGAWAWRSVSPAPGLWDDPDDSGGMRTSAPSPALHPLAHTLHRILVEDMGLRRGASVLLAVSGGPDSMALLHLFASLQPLLALRLSTAHIDHGLRPAESPQEWALVQESCAALHIPCTCIRVDVRAEAAQRKISLEHAARDLRYQALERHQREVAAEWLALAHTADDQEEEILLRLLRGGGRKALSGMRLRSGTRIRPLLGIAKKELLAYLDQHGHGSCHDSSNDDHRFLRNRIRHHLLPLLEREYDAGIRQALRKCADNLAADEAFLEELTLEAWTRAISIRRTLPGAEESAMPQPGWDLHLPTFRAMPQALQRRLLERLLYTAQGYADYGHIMALIHLAAPGTHGKELHLHQGLRALVQHDLLHLFFPWGQGSHRRSCKPT